jgi:diadenosine tetraphosphate (Ap4A) HIT family hydrolase
MPLRLPDLTPCYFCEIVAGRIHQWGVIEQAALTLAILNGRQYEIGQCIVFPRRHAPTLLDLTGEEAEAVIAAAQRLSHMIMRAFDPDGLLLYQSNGLGSGQEVPHFHLHVVPRRTNGGWGGGPPLLAEVERGAVSLDHTEVTEEKLATAATLRLPPTP